MRLSVLGLLLFLSSAALGQIAPQAPRADYARADYEGQVVSAISLIANPHRDLRPLYAVVTQKAGEPYSQAKIDASAQALQEAGPFSKVDVSTVPEINGLRVSFLLEPPYYLGIVNFGGATRTFSYTRLLQVVDLSDEDPYDPSRIPTAEAALTTFLHKNGYFQATVQAEPDIDDTHQIVSVTFNVELGKQAKIESVSVEGPANQESERLLRSVESLRARLSGAVLKRGQPYSERRVTAATGLMRRTLRKQRRLASTIHENPPQYHADTNRVDVSFKVEIGPVVTVRTVGARLSIIPFLSGRRERRLIPIYSEGTIDQDLVDEGQRNLIDFFQKRGYYDVKVTTRFQKAPDEITVVYEIDRGRKHRVDRILFHGNYAISQRELQDQVLVKKSRVWSHGRLSEQLLRQSADNITALYRDRGYEEVKVKSNVEDRQSRIDVNFDIDEGPQTIVDDVRITGNQNLSSAELTAPKGFQLRPGAPFSPRRLADDRNRMSANYLNRGYLTAEVKASVEKSPDNPHRVTVAYAITENQLVRINDVVYLGQKRTQMALLTRVTKIPPETPMRRGQLLDAESRLYDLNIFDWASVGPRRPITDQKDEETLVRVHEAKRNEITYGFGFEVSHRGGNVPAGSVPIPGGGGTINLGNNKIAPSEATFASPRGSIEYNRRNMRGMGETAAASLLLSRLDQKALATYTQPRFVGSNWSSLYSFSAERNSENPLFTASLGDLSFQVERAISQKHNTRLQLRYEFNKTILSHLLVPDLVLPQDQNVRLSTVSASLIRDTRDKPLDAHKGDFATADLGITPTALGSSATFSRLFLQYAYYKPVSAVVLANSIRLGLAVPYSGSFVPTSQLFFSGGGTSLRGFPIDAAGPQRLVPFCNVLEGESGCVNVTVPVGGKQLLILNSEVRFRLGIMKALGGVVFYDGGNVYSAINLRNLVDNYTNTVGIGLRYATPIGPVRIDFGRNLNPVPGINRNQYFITIGQAF